MAFRKNRENPALQGGLDLSYGIAYFGLFASNVDFGRNTDAATFSGSSKIASAELDIYAGIKPVVGPATFDLGVIYYTYPGANDDGVRRGQTPEQDYLEFKGGVSGAFFPSLPKLTLGGTVYYSNNYQAGQKDVTTVEGTAAYELPAIGKITPTISGLIGAQYGDAGRTTVGSPVTGFFTLGNGSDDLTYWNVGVTLAVEKFSFDFRYWDTDISNANNFCSGRFNQCDERFVFLGKFTY